MYITSSVFNIIKKQFEDMGLANFDISSTLNIDLEILNQPTATISSDILGCYIELIINKSCNHRLGLEKGFEVPVTIAGMLYKLYENCATLKEVFEKSDVHTPTINPLYRYINRIDENIFVHRICVDEGFAKKYPVATRQLYESQLGISLQILYSLTGKRIKPIKIHTIYEQDDDDRLSEYLKCPIKYATNEFALLFDSSILDLPILTANNQLLGIVEKLINEIKESKQGSNLSVTIHKYLLQCLPVIDVDIKTVARKLNLGERTLQRRLRNENTSFREILNNVRIELSERYIKENVSFVEIAFLLGFDSQSAFNKFFQKHFKEQPSIFKRHKMNY
ncbi:helix-turn-helix transcriptional regulator [Parabacteroides sp. APC149_11_2_Y6]|uniref:helix-turn-helix transcriptional regulator n=2 Tax=Bacteroides TaxID=816 RepID=UPI0022AAD351|nr:helix-turn-helix transcriptional regulator [Bacteroides fragilis]MCZ2661601.1 helix-turn-helix transcriptional regulator [Bacteroides fragilis]